MRHQAHLIKKRQTALGYEPSIVFIAIKENVCQRNGSSQRARSLLTSFCPWKLSTMPCYVLLYITCICFLPFTSSTPLNSLSTRNYPPSLLPSHLSTRQDVPFACSGDPLSTFDSSCWDILKLEEYLVDPTTGWNTTIPKCDDTSKCCKSDEPWSTCYLRLATGKAGWDCLSIAGDDCTWDRSISDHLDPSIRGRVRYITKTIFEIHNFFTKYFEGRSAPRWFDDKK